MPDKEKKYITVRDILQLDNELIDNISSLIKLKSSASLSNIFTDLHSADIAEIINHLDYQEALYCFNSLNTEMASDVITELDDNLREKILKKIDTQKISVIVDELETDDATDILAELPSDVAEQVLNNIDVEDSLDVKELLKYPEDSAGGIMTSDFLFIFEGETVQDAIKVVRENSDEFEHIYHIYVYNDQHELLGYVLLKSLLVNRFDKNIEDVMEKDLIFVTPETDQEEVANLIEKYDLVAIPVVNEEKKMLGRITVDDIVDVIQEEASEDIQKMAGLSDEQESSSSIFRIMRLRLPWLIGALILELLASKVLENYQIHIEQFIAATFFIPVVMAMGGSSGTQAAIVMVRGLGTGDVWLKESFKILLKEFFVSFFNGVILGVILLAATYLFFSSSDITVSFMILLSLTLLLIIILATMVGASIPLIMKKFNIDPAIATGPFVTTTNDILGLIIYLSSITIFFLST